MQLTDLLGARHGKRELHRILHRQCRERQRMALRSASSTTRHRRPSVSRSLVARTRTAGTTIRSTSMHPGVTTSRASPPATPARSAEADRWPRAAPTTPATAECRYLGELRRVGAVHRQRDARPSARQQRLVQPPRQRYVPRHRRRVRHRVVQRRELRRPRHDGTTVNGTCTDKAGNRAGGTSPSFKYDSTPPTLTNVGFDWDDGTATLTWTASPDTKAIEIDRTPGTAGADPSAVFKGLASSFEDRGLKNKVKYVYTINVFDEAGNKATDTRQHHSRSKALLACPWDDVEEPAAAGLATRRGGCLLQRPALLRSRSDHAASLLGRCQRPQGHERLAAAAALPAQESVEVQREGPQARARATIAGTSTRASASGPRTSTGRSSERATSSSRSVSRSVREHGPGLVLAACASDAAGGKCSDHKNEPRNETEDQQPH